MANIIQNRSDRGPHDLAGVYEASEFQSTTGTPVEENFHLLVGPRIRRAQQTIRRQFQSRHVSIAYQRLPQRLGASQRQIIRIRRSFVVWGSLRWSLAQRFSKGVVISSPATPSASPRSPLSTRKLSPDLAGIPLLLHCTGSYPWLLLLDNFRLTRLIHRLPSLFVRCRRRTTILCSLLAFESMRLPVG